MKVYEIINQYNLLSVTSYLYGANNALIVSKNGQVIARLRTWYRRAKVRRVKNFQNSKSKHVELNFFQNSITG